MWGLDRFSANSTPAPPRQRPYSQLPPRRSSHLAPPNAAPGRAATSTSPSQSSSNLPGTARLPNGSSLRYQVGDPAPVEVEDPVRALKRAIGVEIVDVGVEVDSVQPIGVLEDVAFADLSLNELAGEEFSDDTDSSVDSFVSRGNNLDSLHNDVLACDEVLKTVETYLVNFQRDLGAVSAEIESLQTRSTLLNNQLENRRKVDSIIGPLVEEATLPPSVVRKLSEGPIDDDYVRALDDMQNYVKTMRSKSKETAEAKAAEQLKSLVDDLSNRAVERIRDFFAAGIKSLRSPNINAQVIQQQSFLRYRSLYTFLSSRQPQLGDDMCQAYVNTMRWYYSTHFTRYHAALSKLKLHPTDRRDVIGEDPHRASNSAVAFDPFNLARRGDVLKQRASMALPASTAEEAKAATNLETPFLAYNLALVDNASFEYSFLTAFFSSPAVPSSTTAKLSWHFTSMFEQTLSLGHELTRSLVAETFDALGVLIAVRLNNHFAFTLQRRKIPALDAYTNGTTMLLWPRFQIILNSHAESLKRLTASLPSRAGASSAAMAVLGGGAAGAAGPSTAPHPTTQRFALFVSAILALSAEAADDEPVSHSLARLRGEFEALLSKMANAFAAGDKGRRERARFLANNYALVAAIVADANGRLAEDTREAFETLRVAHQP